MLRAEVATAWAPRVTSGGLEAVKWLALLCMLVDHVNAVLFARQLPEWATVVGRVSFPLFALVFACNLTRPGINRMDAASRLVIAGGLAQPFHGIAFGTAAALWPLNIMFLFAAVVAIVASIERGRAGWALAAFLAASLLVEYFVAGALLCVASWVYFRRPTSEAALAVVLATLGLCLYNGNAYALLALPLFWGLSGGRIALPRSRWAFYAFYPAHLAVLVLLR